MDIRVLLVLWILGLLPFWTWTCFVWTVIISGFLFLYAFVDSYPFCWTFGFAQTQPLICKCARFLLINHWSKPECIRVLRPKTFQHHSLTLSHHLCQSSVHNIPHPYVFIFLPSPLHVDPTPSSLHHRLSSIQNIQSNISYLPVVVFVSETVILNVAETQRRFNNWSLTFSKSDLVHCSLYYSHNL